MIVLEVLAIALGAAVMAVALRVAGRDPVITTRPAPPPPRRTATAPAQLVEVERLLGGVSRAADVHHRLRPVLREIAAARLRRRGVRLDHDCDRARGLLGDELWEIVRPGRPLPGDRFGPGLSGAELRRLVERLETV